MLKYKKHTVPIDTQEDNLSSTYAIINAFNRQVREVEHTRASAKLALGNTAQDTTTKPQLSPPKLCERGPTLSPKKPPPGPKKTTLRLNLTQRHDAFSMFNTCKLGKKVPLKSQTGPNQKASWSSYLPKDKQRKNMSSSAPLSANPRKTYSVYTSDGHRIKKMHADKKQPAKITAAPPSPYAKIGGNVMF
jgi:hypothetical protein